MKKIVIVLVFVCSILKVSFSQEINPLEGNYTRADSIALSLKAKKYTVDDLTGLLTKDLKTDHEKCRAIFRWITENISYSFSNKTRDVNKVLQKREAVCMGYSALFETMCRKAGIECETVAGFAKIAPEDIGQKQKQTNHSWNVVKLYGKWYLIDATWAAGDYNRKYVKNFDDSYFLTDPKYLIYSHYPEDPKYQYLDTVVSMETFIKYPIVYSGLMKNRMQVKTMPEGKLKHELHIQFTTTVPIVSVYGMFDGDKVSSILEYISHNNEYTIDYKFPLFSKGNYSLFVNGRAVFGFKK